MSKGQGRIERAVLAALAQCQSNTALSLACDVYGIGRDANGNRWCNDAQHASVRRALRKLLRIGLIEGQRAGWRDGRARYWLKQWSNYPGEKAPEQP
jgi:hypothetical protein